MAVVRKLELKIADLFHVVSNTVLPRKYLVFILYNFICH